MGTHLNRQKYGETPEEYAAMRKAKGYDDTRVAPEGERAYGSNTVAPLFQRDYKSYRKYVCNISFIAT